MTASKKQYIPLQLQPRDFALLRGLFESRVMNGRHISTLYFDGKREYAKKRLQKIKAAGYIGERKRNANESSVLFLTRKGFTHLKNDGQLSQYPPLGTNSFEARANVSQFTLRHELEIMDVKSAFRSALAESQTFSIAEFSTWPLLYQFETPRTGYGSDILVKPDGFIRIHEREADGGLSEHTFFLEVDRSSEKQDTLINRAVAYLAYYKSGGFAVNSDWNLNIVDVNSNVVQTSSGSGTSMLYNWDGTGTGETALPNGIYYYYISATTNGEPDEVESGGSGGGSGSSPPTPDFARSSGAFEASELWAVAPDSENVVPFAIYPPGFDTNGFTIFSASPSEVASLTATSSSTRLSITMDSGGSFSPDASGGGSSAASQNSPVTPQRPPNNPVRGLAGTFGIAYDTYSANGTNGFTLAPVLNGLGLPGDYVQMEGHPGNYSGHDAPLLPYKAEANNFISQMQHWGWNNTLLKVDNQLNINNLIGSGTPFNNVNLGVLMFHGAYGTTIDYNGQPAKQIYFPVTSGGSAQYLRLEQMNLGGSGANGLKWMALLACNSLFHTDWQSMQSAGGYPYNSNLHLLLGVETTNYTSNTILWRWAKYMNYGTSTSAGAYNPLTIRAAWYQAARDAYSGGSYANTIKFSVAGDAACFDDYLQTNYVPEGSWTIDSPQQVWP